MKLIHKLFGSIVFAILIYSGFMLFSMALKYESGSIQYAEIQNMISTIDNTSTTISGGDSLTESMKSINSDYIAWIKIEGSQINYPIVIESSDIDYLTHDFRKSEDFYGCLFIGQTDPFSTGNTFIYGHNMKNGEMFGSLKKYLDQSYLNEHKDITIYYNGQSIKYRIFSAQVVEVGYQPYEQSSQLTEPTSMITLSTCYTSSKRLLVQAIR